MSPSPEVVLIAAVARNRVIGRDNTLPWRLKADLVNFRKVTMGYPVLMGRKTWESLSRPLPGRRNLVITRKREYEAVGAEIYPDPDSALHAVADQSVVFVIGGAEIYRQLLVRASTLMLTEVADDVDGDAHFPAFSPDDFIESSRIRHTADANNDHDFDFVEYRRRV